MAFVIGEPCVNVKDTACVDACPVDSIHSIEGAPQYYIEPATCIDCGACEPVCPVKAIWPGDQVPEAQKKFIAINVDFFKGFDKANSSSYTRPKKATKEGETATTASIGKTGGSSAEVTAARAEWKEVSGWEKLWESRTVEMEDRTEVHKRYGRVRAVIEEADRYTVRIFLPERTPPHMFRYKFGLPETMCGYRVTAELHGNVAKIRGVVSDPMIAKLCGLSNSFPDSFYAEVPFSGKVKSLSVKVQGPHIVDVVAIRDLEEAKAA